MLSKENASAERIEAGPGPEQVAEENRSETATGPRGDVASHFVGLLFFYWSLVTGHLSGSEIVAGICF